MTFEGWGDPVAGLRTTVRAVLIAVATAAAACGPIDDPTLHSDVERELDRGAAYARSLTARSSAPPTAEEAIAAGYLERLRLGLGSPFRLIEYSLQDPRLPRSDRELLAWALLDRTVDGRTYHIDPEVLDRRDAGDGARHLSLITGAIRGSADPDAGVLAVRLAYTMAEAEASASAALVRRVSRVASLVRDRVVSQNDAERLLRAAGTRTDPMALLTVWRVQGEFAVERPTVLSPPSGAQRDAIALAPRLLESVREIQDPSASGRPAPRLPPSRPLLTPRAARVLALHTAEENAPVQTPVVVAARTFGRLLSEDDSAAARFFANAVNEERLAAERALLAHSAGTNAPVAYATVAAAVGLRAYAQERPWFPGFGGPTQRDLEDRFGLASVRFPDDVPSHWRPYYRRMLESSLSDLRRVLPSLDLRGLHVRFEERAGSPGTLAVHDPKSRTIHIPTATGAGTLAHEIAHDVDWQMALRRYGVRGDYGTDRAVRLADGRLAEVLRGLTAASLPEGASLGPSHATRPAEVFARNMDWFVAVALAREGRVNGYLSSVQDDVLTGYGTVMPPDVTGGAGEALVALLDEVAPVYAETRRWFLSSYGRVRAPTAYDLARRLVEARLDSEATAPPPVEEALDSVAADSTIGLHGAPGLARLGLALARLDSLEVARDEVLAVVDGVCRAVPYDNGATAARRRLVGMVTEARARGVALEAADALAGAGGRDWLAARLAGLSRDPAPPEEVLPMLVRLVERVEAVGAGPPARSSLGGATSVTDCGPLPFMVDG